MIYNSSFILATELGTKTTLLVSLTTYLNLFVLSLPGSASTKDILDLTFLQIKT